MSVKRFRMIAGPNGSGKSTLVTWLRDDYRVNFYSFINADDILVQLQRFGAYSPMVPLTKEDLISFAVASEYDEDVKALFCSNEVTVCDDCIRFSDKAINAYSAALLANFLQNQYLGRGESFSQETVFSHPSKVEALPHWFGRCGAVAF